MKQSSEDENDEARLHQELGGGEGIGRAFVLIDLGDAVWDQEKETIVLELLPFSCMLSYLR